MSVWGSMDKSTPEDKGGQRHAKLEIQCIEEICIEEQKICIEYNA